MILDRRKQTQMAWVARQQILPGCREPYEDLKFKEELHRSVELHQILYQHSSCATHQESVSQSMNRLLPTTPQRRLAGNEMGLWLQRQELRESTTKRMAFE